SFGKPNSGGVAPPALALTRKPVPGVVNREPRTWKVFPGNGFGSDAAAPTPSQLISRRRPPKEPLAPATVPPPTAVRKSSRAGVIAAALAPAASNDVKMGAAQVAGATSSAAAPATTRRRFMGSPCLGTWTGEMTKSFLYMPHRQRGQLDLWHKTNART